MGRSLVGLVVRPESLKVIMHGVFYGSNIINIAFMFNTLSSLTQDNESITKNHHVLALMSF